MDRILQEIASVGRRLEATDLTVASSSIRVDTAGFRETLDALDQRLTAMEDQVAALPDQEAELRSLRAKVTDLEDRSRRDNVRFFGVLEHKERSDIKAFLKSLLSDLFGIEVSQPPEFQTAHSIGPLHKATSDKPRPIIACFLRHEQARKIRCTTLGTSVASRFIVAYVACSNPAKNGQREAWLPWLSSTKMPAAHTVYVFHF
ncbi:hypothetical protein NDU88_009001 [Pleurodeles waltl]|uniref:Uncharacterized protein n=1 Tax=Pleurodeles waltl TaxID=8319 RepID=A0AAV7PRI6_PLEWA|nr:hypothetical protein NDU88_009001 [Pleurodeles waltl]